MTTRPLVSHTIFYQESALDTFVSGTVERDHVADYRVVEVEYWGDAWVISASVGRVKQDETLASFDAWYDVQDTDEGTNDYPTRREAVGAANKLLKDINYGQ